MEHNSTEHNRKLTAYFNWARMMLLGGDPVRADNYLKVNFKDIYQTAWYLINKINYKPKEIYRGVILFNKVDELVPHDNFTYLSFSEDINVAKTFAEPKGKMTFWDMGNYGYLIKYTPSKAEILYHHRFTEILPIREWFLHIGLGTDTLDEQKEITILQSPVPYKLELLHEISENTII